MQPLQEVIAAWWQGQGIDACCSGCGNHVIFTVTEKRCANQADIATMTVLPDDWYRTVNIVNERVEIKQRRALGS